MRAVVRAGWIGALFLVLAGCASLYFETAGPPPPPATRQLAHWPWREYWTGIVFNGEKIGFSRLSLAPAEDASGEYVVRSETALRFRFLALDKSITSHAEDRVGPDLTLRAFHHEQTLDGNRLETSGRVRGRQLVVETGAGAERETKEHELSGPVYPASVLAMLPLYQGMAIGQRHLFTVYDSETQQLTEVLQEVLGYERSDLFDGPAFRLRTTMHGQEITTWLGPDGLPVLEMSLNGALVAGLETETQARQSLASAALNKSEVLLEFSQVRVDRPIEDPLAARRLKLALTGADPGALPPSDARQRCARNDAEIVCDIGPTTDGQEALPAGARERYLKPTFVAPAANPRIAELASRTAGQAGARAQVHALVDWIQQNIERSAADVFTALDVLRTRKAECQGHSFLYAALARARGLPTRVVNGLVYSGEHGAFLYHTWTETWVDGQWLAVDPTFGQVGVDATHLKLLEGENPAELTPLLAYLGRTRARILEIQ